MYKKVTHTIVEEHFGHPMAVDIATHHNAISKNKKRVPAMADIMPESQFRSFIDNYFIENEGKLIKLADASFDPSLDFQTAIGNAMNVDALTDLLSKYYDIEFRERLSNHLHNIVMSIMYIWRNQSRGFDNTELTDRLYNVAKYLPLLLNQYNNNWNSNALEPVFKNLITELIKLGTAKKTKNTAGVVAAKDAIASNSAELANLIASGVVKQHPNFFTA